MAETYLSHFSSRARGQCLPRAHYDLELVERAPLPPHERTWRHPSELGPSAPIDTRAGETPHGFSGILATGTLAVIVVAALVVTISPRRSNGPVALTATTLPAAAQTFRSAVSTVTTGDLQAGVVALANSVRTARIDDFTAIPSAIASVPGGVASGGMVLTDIAADQIAFSNVMLPDLTDEVNVISRDFTYAVEWREVAQLTTVDDAVVVANDGAIIAIISDGRLVVASDSYGGVNVGEPVSVSRPDTTASRLSPDD